MPAYRPLEVEPGRGRWQRERLLAALARLTLAPGLTLPELLVAEAPRLPRSLVVLAITPDLGPALGAALAGLRRSGFEAAVVWIQTGEPAPDAAAGLPEGVPVHSSPNEADLRRPGSPATVSLPGESSYDSPGLLAHPPRGGAGGGHRHGRLASSSIWWMSARLSWAAGRH